MRRGRRLGRRGPRGRRERRVGLESNVTKPLKLEGKKFGRLTVRRRSGSVGGRAAWLCSCRCGKTTVAISSDLVRRHSRSCGCLKAGALAATSTSHGDSGSAEHAIWRAMHSRCRNKNHHSYSYYGGRGISVCRRWRSYEAFLSDVGRRPGRGYQIDRIDNGEGYRPGNVRWATRSQQARNKRNSHYVILRGKKIHLGDALKIAGITKSGYRYRISKGMTRSQAIMHQRYRGIPRCR